MSDDFEIDAACTVALCVMLEAEWEWDTTSELITDQVFELNCPNNSIATKIDQHANDSNCMVVGRVMRAGIGKHTISIKQEQGSAGYTSILCDADHWKRESRVGWFMYSAYGGLCGNGKHHDDMAGRIKAGRVLAMQLDMDAGTLKFWVDDKPYGPGYTSGVTGPLRWAATLFYTSNTVEIVSTPELQPWEPPE